VVDDRCVPGRLQLLQEFPDEHGLPGAGVAGDEQVTRLEAQRNPHRRSAAKQAVTEARDLKKPDAITACAVVQLRHGDELGPLQSSAFSPRATTRGVLWQRNDQPHEEHAEGALDRWRDEIDEALIAID